MESSNRLVISSCKKSEGQAREEHTCVHTQHSHTLYMNNAPPATVHVWVWAYVPHPHMHMHSQHNTPHLTPQNTTHIFVRVHQRLKQSGCGGGAEREREKGRRRRK